MASWLSAGSVDDGTVVRRTSAANPTLNFTAPDLFSPSKLESIFHKDDSLPNDESNENISFIPSPVKRATSYIKPWDQLSNPLKYEPATVSGEGSFSFRHALREASGNRSLPLPHAPIKPLEELTLPPESSPPKSTPVDALDESTLPSDLSQGTSVAIKPKKRQSLGTGDYLSEASRVMTYLRQQPAAAAYEERDSANVSSSDLRQSSIAESRDQEIADNSNSAMPQHQEMANTSKSVTPQDPLADYEAREPGDVSFSHLRKNSSTEFEGRDRTNSSSSSLRRSRGAEYERMRPANPAPSTTDVSLANDKDTVIRSPSKHIDWVEHASPMPQPDSFSSLRRSRGAEYEQMRPPNPAPSTTDVSLANVKDTTVIRSPSKHVDWVEYASPNPQPNNYNTPKFSNYHTPKYSSILSLTPLPDFTAHEEDVQHPERSFIDERAHERALRQAHGTLAQTRDALIRAITDAKPEELYWEEITQLDLKGTGLSSVNGLDELCPNLIVLDISENSLTHLNGIPSSVRDLHIACNLLSDMVSWNHLTNLQNLNVSGNKNITNLDGFCDLIHLRTLRANKCSIGNIDGIRPVDGLLSLQLRGNKLKSLDFGTTNFFQLKSLDLCCNRLESVAHLNKLVALEDCHLSHNFLTEIVPAGRRGPRDLEVIEADHNLLDTFNLKQYPNLRYAMLDYNRLTRIHGLGKTPFFDELSIQNQDVASDIVNRVLSTPNDCNTLILSGNPVPNGCLDLPELPQHSLRALELTDCGIKQLGAGFGRLFPNVRLLTLNANHIQDLTDLQGMKKIRRLELIRNRISRMRRTCLLLARLPALSMLDMRDNPLTMAFHPNVPEDAEADAKWLRTLDENTKMRRRLTELLLAEHCKQLQQLDGLAFERTKVLKKEEVWRKCEERGALQRQ